MPNYSSFSNSVTLNLLGANSLMGAIGTVKAGHVIANVKARIPNFNEVSYPKELMLRDINNIISDLLAEGGIDRDDYSVKLSIPNTDDVVNLSDVTTDYKLIDSISSITYDGGKAQNLTEDEYDVQKQYGAGSIYSDTVIWYRKNYTLYFTKGTGYTGNYGTRYMNVNRIPNKVTSVDDEIDVKDNKIGLVEKRLEDRVRGIQYSTDNKVIKMKQTDNETKALVKEK